MSLLCLDRNDIDKKALVIKAEYRCIKANIWCTLYDIRRVIHAGLSAFLCR